jgi:hypothetical protein
MRGAAGVFLPAEKIWLASYCPQNTPKDFSSRVEDGARIRPCGKRTVALNSRGCDMGELFFLASCVGAFAAGLAIAGVSLFG